MANENLIKGNTEDDVWQQINAAFLADPDPIEYTAVIEQNGKKILLNIDIDLGGGFESGYETTMFTAPLHTTTAFRFAIHKEHFTDELGKFFGMQDEVIGYEEFDKKLIVKTNQPSAVKAVFADASARTVFQSLENFSFGITTHHSGNKTEKEPYLELTIEAGITDVSKLRIIYSAFFSVLTEVVKV